MRPFIKERRERILGELFKAGHVWVRDLADELDISEATVRRDLRALADSGQVELVYGGAALMRTSDYSFRTKATRSIEAKQLIGRMAAAMVTDGDQVFLDSGTTCFEIAPHLKRRHGLTVIVNSARLALELDTPGLNVILLGGQYRPERMDTVGPLAMNTLEQLRGYTAFIGADGLSMDFGLTASDIESAHLYRSATRNARETVLVVDHTKFASPSLFKIVDFDAISRVVTDRDPGHEWREFLSEGSIGLVTGEGEVAEGEAAGGGSPASQVG